MTNAVIRAMTETGNRYGHSGPLSDSQPEATSEMRAGLCDCL